MLLFFIAPFYIPQFPRCHRFSSRVASFGSDWVTTPIGRVFAEKMRLAAAAGVRRSQTFYRFFNRVTQFTPPPPPADRTSSCPGDIAAGRKKEPLATSDLPIEIRNKRRQNETLSLRKPAEERTSVIFVGQDASDGPHWTFFSLRKIRPADRDIAIISCDPTTRTKWASIG